MSLNSAANILLFAVSIVLMWYAGMQFYKLSLDYQKDQRT
jgi:hypothetical protein